MAVMGDNSALGVSYGAARGHAKEAEKNEQSFGGNCYMHEKTKHTETQQETMPCPKSEHADEVHYSVLIFQPEHVGSKTY